MTNPTILVIEDNPYTRKVVVASLAAEGYHVLEAETGQMGVTLMGEERPDLVLQDLMLPDIDGLELVKVLRGLPNCTNVPILAFSSFLGKLEEARLGSGNFQRYIAKPIEPSELVRIISEELGKRPHSLAAH